MTRHLDRPTSTLSNRLAIYRKPCHSSSYIHYLSAQPVSVKRSVIRSIFLRAYRYCDPLFLNNEIDRIYADFSRLGYNRRFIDKARRSAKEGHEHEVRFKNGEAHPNHHARDKTTPWLSHITDVLLTSVVWAMSMELMWYTHVKILLAAVLLTDTIHILMQACI